MGAEVDDAEGQLGVAAVEGSEWNADDLSTNATRNRGWGVAGRKRETLVINPLTAKLC